MRRTLLTLLTCLAVPVSTAGTPIAYAGWSASAGGAAAARAETIAPTTVSAATASGRNATVTWAASSFATGAPVGGYRVRRYDGAGTAQTVAGGCAGTVTALTCTETAVPPGTWTYSVVPAHEQWRGPESARSTTVVVQAPELELTTSTVTSLPATIGGTLSGYVTGSTVTFKLDDPEGGATLTGTVSPSPVGSDGTASVSITLPDGIANGAHTIYAIDTDVANDGDGDGKSDRDGAAVTVDVASTTPVSFTTAAYGAHDASSGTEFDVSHPTALVADGLAFTGGASPIAFSATSYRELDFNAPLPPGRAVWTPELRYHLNGNGATACFYFDVRRASSGELLSTVGSPASPVACSSSATGATTSTPIPGLSTTDAANDLRIRVYETNSAAAANTVDLATVSVPTGARGYTLHDRRFEDRVATAAGATWPLAAGGDGRSLLSRSGWATTFSAASYLRLTVPPYVPASATSVSATLRLAYRSERAGTTTCQYVEVYAGAALLSAHGSADAPLSCNAGSDFVTDTIALPAVDTPAEANDLAIRVYLSNDAKGKGQSRSEHDLATVSITYSD